MQLFFNKKKWNFQNMIKTFFRLLSKFIDMKVVKRNMNYNRYVLLLGKLYLITNLKKKKT